MIRKFKCPYGDDFEGGDENPIEMTCDECGSQDLSVDPDMWNALYVSINARLFLRRMRRRNRMIIMGSCKIVRAALIYPYEIVTIFPLAAC